MVPDSSFRLGLLPGLRLWACGLGVRGLLTDSAETVVQLLVELISQTLHGEWGGHTIAGANRLGEGLAKQRR